MLKLRNCFTDSFFIGVIVFVAKRESVVAANDKIYFLHFQGGGHFTNSPSTYAFQIYPMFLMPNVSGYSLL